MLSAGDGGTTGATIVGHCRGMAAAEAGPKLALENSAALTRRRAGSRSGRRPPQASADALRDAVKPLKDQDCDPRARCPRVTAVTACWSAAANDSDCQVVPSREHAGLCGNLRRTCGEVLTRNQNSESVTAAAAPVVAP